MCAGMWVLKLMSGVFLDFILHFLYWGRVSHLKLELADLTSPAGQLALGILHFCLPSFRIIRELSHHVAFFVGAGGLNSSSHFWAFHSASLLPVWQLLDLSLVSQMLRAKDAKQPADAPPASIGCSKHPVVLWGNYKATITSCCHAKTLAPESSTTWKTDCSALDFFFFFCASGELFITS